MGLLGRMLDKIEDVRNTRIEFQQIEYRNAVRRADVNAVMLTAASGMETAKNSAAKSRYSRLMARAEVLKDRLEQIERAISERNIECARTLDKVVGNALDKLKDDVL